MRTSARSETQIQAAVKDALERIGCLVWRQPNVPTPGRRSRTLGLPDLGGIAPGGRALMVEVKRPGKKPSPDQTAWLDAVARHGGIALCATSVDDVHRLYLEATLHGGTDGIVLGWTRVKSPWSTMTADERRAASGFVPRESPAQAIERSRKRGLMRMRQHHLTHGKYVGQKKTTRPKEVAP